MRSLLILFLLATVMLKAQPTASISPPRPRHEAGRVTLALRVDPTHGLRTADALLLRARDLAASVGGTLLGNRFPLPPRRDLRPSSSPLARLFELAVPVGNEDRCVAVLSRHPEVEYAERIPLAWPLSEPSDSLLSYQFALRQVHWTDVWDLIAQSQRDTTITIGIVDTGVEWYHQDLVQSLAQNLGEDANGNGRVFGIFHDRWEIDSTDLNGVDDDGNGYVDDLIGWNVSGSRADQDPDDFNGHGTHVAGIAAARTDNGIGICSPALGVKFIPVAINESPQGPGKRAIDGVLYCARRGASVINCSWAQAWSRADQEALDEARDLGALVVAAAGNSADPALVWPASYRGVIAVGAVADNDLRATYSSYGPQVDLCAPGGDYRDAGILSTWIDSSYTRLLGTSQAAPLVTGALALLKSLHPDWSRDRLLLQLLTSCDPLDTLNSEYRGILGEGRLNIHRMLTDLPTAPPRARLTMEARFERRGTDGPFLPGDTVDLHLTLHSWTHAHPPRTLQLEVLGDAQVVAITAPVSTSLQADTVRELESVLRVRLSPELTNGQIVPIRITGTCAGLPLLPDSVIVFPLRVGSGGVLVWNRGVDSTDAFLAQGLGAAGLSVTRTRRLPGTLRGWDAVFITAGLGPTPIPDFSPAEVEALVRYHASGGRVYLEGLWSAETVSDSLLASLFGCGNFRVRTGLVSSGALIGQEGGLAEGIRFPPLTRPFGFAGILQGEGGTARSAMVDSLFGTILLQHHASGGGRAVLFSWLLGELKDQSPVLWRRAALLQKILGFFGLSDSLRWCMPHIAVDSATGHAPASCRFSASADTEGPDPVRWTWDLDGDGQDDREGQEVDYTFGTPGIRSPRLTAWVGSQPHRITADSLVRVFDGESALHFDGGDQAVLIPADPSLALHDSLTFEAWIKPEGWGEEPLEGFGRIMDKGRKVLFFVSSRGSLLLNIFLPSLLYANCETDPGTIRRGEWQHVAFSYHAPTSEARLYIDGQRMPSTTLHPFAGRIPDHASDPLVLGNREDRRRCFDGAIDEVRIWNRIRTDEEIHRDARRLILPHEPGLVAWYRCQEGRGIRLHDETGQGFEGRIEASFAEGISLSNTSGIRSGPSSWTLLSLHPHPFSVHTRLTLRWTGGPPPSVSLMDLLGRDHSATLTLSQDADILNLDISGLDLPSGPYFLSIRSTSGIQRVTLLRL